MKGDRGHAPAALKVQLRLVQDKLKIYDALKRAITEGRNLDYEFQNEVPQYALHRHKNLHKVAHKVRRMDANIKTRVSMGKGTSGLSYESKEGVKQPKTSARTAD